MLKSRNRIIGDMNVWNRSKSKGFTYIELVLALAIITFIVLAFTQLFLSSSISVKNMQFQTLAYNFAGDKMEEIKNEPFDSIGNEQETQTLSGKTFTRNVTISRLEDSLIRVDIEVIWTEGGENRSINISSLIAER